MCRRKAARWTDYVTDENADYYEKIKCHPIELFNDSD